MEQPNKSPFPHKTVLTIVVGMIVLFLVFKIKLLLTIGLLIGIAGISSDWLAKQIDFVWMKLAWVLSLIVPNIVLSVIFYLFLTPIAFFNKLFGQKDPLSIKQTDKSLYKTHEKTFDKAYFEKHW